MSIKTEFIFIYDQFKLTLEYLGEDLYKKLEVMGTVQESDINLYEFQLKDF